MYATMHVNKVSLRKQFSKAKLKISNYFMMCLHLISRLAILFFTLRRKQASRHKSKQQEKRKSVYSVCGDISKVNPCLHVH